MELIYAKKSEKIGNQHGEDLGGWVVYDYLYLLVVGGGGYSRVVDMAQDLQLRDHEGAFAEVDGEAIGDQHGEDLVQVVQMLRWVLMPILLSSIQVSTLLIYCPLKCLSSIPQAKTQEEILKQSKGCDNRSFGDVGGGYGYLIVAFDQVNLAKEVQQCSPLARSSSKEKIRETRR